MTEQAWYHMTKGDEKQMPRCHCRLCQGHRADLVTRDDFYGPEPDWETVAEGYVRQRLGLEEYREAYDEARLKAKSGWESGNRDGYRVVATWLEASTEATEQQEAATHRDIVTSDTGGSKGTKTARFDLIDQRFLWSLAEVCGFGAGIYGDNNWRRGYDWSLSYAALMRHLSMFLQGEDTDPESGQPHIAHVAWHAMVLFVFSDPGNVDEYGRFDTREEMG